MKKVAGAPYCHSFQLGLPEQVRQEEGEEGGECVWRGDWKVERMQGGMDPATIVHTGFLPLFAASPPLSSPWICTHFSAANGLPRLHQSKSAGCRGRLWVVQGRIRVV